MMVDSHYGRVKIRFDDLLASPDVERLNRVNLANIPKSLCKESSDADRFQHSVGVCYLASLVEAPQHDSTLLEVSALLHDIGIPCFGHIGERIMEDIYGLDHETRGAKMVMDMEDILSKLGADPGEVRDVLLGKHRLSTVIVSSMDLDNLDNIYLYMLSTGRSAHYSPEKIARMFSIDRGKVIFSGTADDILGWRKTRYELYTSLNTLERRTREVMLMHALGLCAASNPEMLFMDNTQAMDMMMDNRSSSRIIKGLRTGRLYKKVLFDYVPFQERKKLETELAEQYPGCVVKVDHLKFDRDISFAGPDGNTVTFPRVYDDMMRAGVYRPF